MKKILLIVLVFASYFNVVSQSIDQYQYWYDNNYANAIVVNNASSGDLVLNTALNTTGVSAGLHNLNFRAKGNDGKWSTILIEQFYNTGNWKIDSYEYWFDNDYDSKITNSVAPEQTYLLTSDFNTSAVSHGTHTLNFRSRDTAGKWSTIVKEYFFKSIAGSQLSAAEYWIDADFDNRQPISFTSSNSVFINQSVLTSVLDNKLHTFNFRMQDQAGKWSSVTSSYFMSQSTIVGYEYWFDANFAQKTAVAITPTNLLTSQPDFDASSLSNGTHVVHFRAKNNLGKYSIVTSKTFIVDIPPSFAITATAGANGSISPNGLTNVLTGTNQSYTITPNSCYQIVDVVVDGVSQGAITTYTFNNVVTTHTISATFSLINVTFYQDLDNDGYGNSVITISACSAPFGYVLNNTDCNDSNAAVNPGTPEVAYDGLDNNCDGNFDEGFPLLTTTLNAVSCDSTLSNIFSSINANYPIVGVTGYRFEITDTTNPSNPVLTIDKTQHWFTLTMLSNYNYATTYSVRVMLKVGATYLGYYGNPCTVTTPSIAAAFGASSLVSPACGSTLAAVSSSMNAKGISGATGYRFKVTRGTEEQTLDRIPQWFQLRQLTTYVYGATYSVEVAFKTTAGYGAFGPVCTIVSPIVPSITSCGTTVAASGQVTVPVLAGVTQYTYEVTGPSGVQVINRTTAHLPVSLITGYSTANTYSIRVAVMSTGVMSDFGAACSINPGSGARFGDSTSTPTIIGTEFKAVGYPNPFETNFTLNVTTTSDENVQVAVYDIIGRQVESKEVNAADANVLEVGSNYPSGVYNVVVSQGVNVKSLRMIKR